MLMFAIFSMIHDIFHENIPPVSTHCIPILIFPTYKTLPEIPIISPL